MSPPKSKGATHEDQDEPRVAQVTADKKKFSILVTMMAVGLLLWEADPAGSRAKIATADDPANAGQTGGSTPEGQALPGTSTTPVLPPLEEVSVTLGEDLPLNLFAFRPRRYKPLPTDESEEIRLS